MTDDRTIAEAATRLVYLTENLCGMVPQAVWRDHGADDGQGHYEGDYHAESVQEEIKALASLPAKIIEMLDERDALRECVGLLDSTGAERFWHAWRTHPYLDQFMERDARCAALDAKGENDG